MNLQFRAEITNALNLANLSDPVLTLSSSIFGTTRSARAMRETQLGLRFSKIVGRTRGGPPHDY